MSAWLDKHRERLDRAVEANRTRAAYVPFVESPSRRHHPEGALGRGQAAFRAQLGQPFALELPGVVGRLGAEVSPFTAEPLGVDYPRSTPDALMQAALAAWPRWRDAPMEERVGVGLEMLDRWAAASFENAFATMHTTGQAFLLAFAGSGASSLDRGLEALAAAYSAMDAMPRRATFRRSFGPGPEVVLDKRYRLMPVGVAVVLSCGSYPAWNAYPAILANLATGNPVVLKPHPDTIWPMALAVRIGREVLAEAGFDPNLLTLAVDTWDQPVAAALLDHPAAAICDFTGGQRFGAEIERRWGGRLQVYTETAGCNAVVLDSARDLDAALRAIAHGLLLFSAQMCTAPQNLWLPPTVRDGERDVPADEGAARLVVAIDAVAGDADHAAVLCGALHSPRTLDELAALRAHPGLLRAGDPYAHPEFPSARTATPVLVGLDAGEREIAQREHFGPMAFVVRAESREAALAGATSDARRFGAIASYAYTTDERFACEVEDAFAVAGASVGLNLVRQRPMNFTAAFSDYHVTGLNPAGTACLTDPAFVARRFRVVQSKRER